MSSKNSITSKAKDVIEKTIECLECNKKIISLIEFPEEEINRLEITCVCGCKFPKKLKNRAKMHPYEGYKIEDIEYERFSRHDEVPKRGQTYIRISKV